MRKEFNPEEWSGASTSLSNQKQVTESGASTFRQAQCNASLSAREQRGEGQTVYEDVEMVVQKVEAAGMDIAPAYEQWRDLGFALSDELGESGRNFYQRLSSFYPGYNSKETDLQFTKCLKARGHGVTIGTLYYLVKQANVSISDYPMSDSRQTISNFRSRMSDNRMSDIENLQTLPTFPEWIFEKLPKILRDVTEKANSADDADLLLLGSVIVLSACLPNVFGIYAGREVFPNLFLFISAQASAGKGRLSLCRKLVEPIHRSLRQLAKAEYEQYQTDLQQYNADKQSSERPKEPPMRMLFIPANNSATGLFQLLKENEEKGLMFETEGDTLAMTFKSEHGNYSDGFRKAFHHETISYNRRRDREYVELKKPRLSALLSGTPKQITALIPNAENGLFSRFIFYHMNIRPEWKDVFAGSSDQTLDEQFEKFGDDFFALYEHLKSHKEALKFTFTAGQQKRFNDYFEQIQLQYLELCGSDYIGTVRRLGLITFRIGMVLTALRIMETGVVENPMVCLDIDFETALEMIKILVKHAAFVFQLMPVEQMQKNHVNAKVQFLEALPDAFDRQTYLRIAETFNIPAKTAEKQIGRFISSGLLRRQKQNLYEKVR
jgi:hypothetical protein